MKKTKFISLCILLTITYCSRAQTHHSQMTNQTVVNTFLAGFNDINKVGQSFALLAENYHFTDPTTTVNSKAEFLELSKALAEVLTGVEVVRMAESGNWVSVHYIFKSSVPGLEVNKANEWFRIKDGIIQESHLIFDATHWRTILSEESHE